MSGGLYSLTGPAPDNMSPECPGKMSDGRIFTDFRSSRCSVLPTIPTPSYHHRMYMQHHAADIAQREWTMLQQRNSCGCDGDTMLAEQYRTVCNKHVCVTTPAVHCGLGTGRPWTQNIT